MTAVQKCPMCRQPLVPPSGPAKATVGLLYFQPLTGRDMTDANRVLSNELFRIGLNLPTVRCATLWPHAPNKQDVLDRHLKRALLALKGCKIVLLFGTQVTTAILGEGISGILGLPQTSELLPKTLLLPAPSPDGVSGKPLGEFRLVMETLRHEVDRL